MTQTCGQSAGTGLKEPASRRCVKSVTENFKKTWKVTEYSTEKYN